MDRNFYKRIQNIFKIYNYYITKFQEKETELLNKNENLSREDTLGSLFDEFPNDLSMYDENLSIYKLYNVKENPVIKNISQKYRCNFTPFNISYNYVSKFIMISYIEYYFYILNNHPECANFCNLFLSTSKYDFKNSGNYNNKTTIFKGINSISSNTPETVRLNHYFV